MLYMKGYSTPAKLVAPEELNSENVSAINTTNYHSECYILLYLANVYDIESMAFRMLGERSNH